MAPLKLTHVPIGKLKPAAYNPRHMPLDELEALAKSLEQFGMVDPIIANKDGTVIGGHQRLKAAALAGMESVPVVFVELDKTQEKALNLALNRIGGEWDEAKLRQVLEDLSASEVDLAATGFTEDELAWLADRGEPWSVDDALEELDMTDAIARPLWVVIRAPAERVDEVKAALATVEEVPDVSIEASC